MNHVFVQTVAERMHLNGEKAREALKRRTLFFCVSNLKTLFIIVYVMRVDYVGQRLTNRKERSL